MYRHSSLGFHPGTKTPKIAHQFKTELLRIVPPISAAMALSLGINLFAALSGFVAIATHPRMHVYTTAHVSHTGFPQHVSTHVFAEHCNTCLQCIKALVYTRHQQYAFKLGSHVLYVKHLASHKSSLSLLYLISESATSSPAWCCDERDGYQESALPTIKITSSSGQDTIILPSISRSTCSHTKIQKRKYRDRLRRLLRTLASRVLVSQSYTLISPQYWSRDRLSLFLRRSLEQEQTLSSRLTSSDLTASMQANMTYDLLWQRQVVLLQQIDGLRDQITQTSYNLDRAERSLARNDGSRKSKKRSKWIRTFSLRRLEAMDIELRARMQNLALCQAQISAAHNAAQQNMLPNTVGAYYNTPYISRYVSQPPSYEETQAFTDAYPPTNHIEVFDLSHMPATPAEPMPPTMRLPPHQPPSYPFRDSGFWELPMHAQPFDLDLTTDNPTHAFSHELAETTPPPHAPATIHPRPDSAAPFASVKTSQPTSSGPNPSAESFTLKPAVRDLKPLSRTHTNSPFVRRGLDTARSSRYISPHLTQSPNSVFLRGLMDRTSPSPAMRTVVGPQLTSSPTSVFLRG